MGNKIYIENPADRSWIATTFLLSHMYVVIVLLKTLVRESYRRANFGNPSAPAETFVARGYYGNHTLSSALTLLGYLHRRHHLNCRYCYLL